jgi:hypothetical protein
VFDANLVSLDEHRNQQLKLNRVSVSADLLKERCSPDKVTFPELMEADVLLLLESIARLGLESAGTWPRLWSARTTVYCTYVSKFPLFMRAADSEVRNGIRTAIGIDTAVDLKTRLESASKRLDGFTRLGRGTFGEFNFLEAINANELVR